LARLRKKEKWLEYAEALKEGLTIEKAAKRCGVDPTMAFRWRHRFLKAFSADKALELSGIAEADGLKGCLHRFKGVATRYLYNYLGWRRFYERHKENACNPKSWLIEAMGAVPG